jgi:hypothetical protein
VCDRWDALIEEDYSSVMPLVINQFMKFEIIQMPPFVFELGIFSKTPINAAKTMAFIDAVQGRFRYYRIVLNKYNPVENFSARYYKRFELDLIKPYHKLAVDFEPDLRRTLNLAMAHDHSLTKGISANDLVRFILLNKVRLSPALRRDNFSFLHALVTGLNLHHAGEVYGILNPRNKLVSVALFIWMGNHIHLIFQAVVPGQNDESFLFLIDRFIEKYSETNSTLIFECLSAANKCRAFLNYAARESVLPVISENHLPLPLRLFSRF